MSKAFTVLVLVINDKFVFHENTNWTVIINRWLYKKKYFFQIIQIGMLNSEEKTLKVYSRRWYILLIFSLHAMFQCTVWNTWGPVESVALVVFKSWTTADISNFANWGKYLLASLFIFRNPWFQTDFYWKYALECVVKYVCHKLTLLHLCISIR